MTAYYDTLSRKEALSILALPDEKLPELLESVYSVRKKYKGNTVGIQFLTNARSGNCSQDCSYCAQSQGAESHISQYKLISNDRLLQDGAMVKEQNLTRHCIGFSEIRFRDCEIKEFAKEIRKLKEYSQTPICCSMGLLTERQANMLREAGVERINHNLNTSRKFYPQICTTHTYQERIDNIHMLQRIGFEICCGGIIGLGEEKTDVVDMLFELQAIAPQAVPINFFIPIKGAALEQADISFLTAEYCLKVLCLARLLIPKADLRCAAGREVYLKGREKEMFCAVDSIFASGYLTVGGQSIEETIQMVTQAGFQYYIETI